MVRGGGVPIYFHNHNSIDLDVDYIGLPGDDIGRHGGIMFCASEPTHRYSGSINGYFLDWIDRASDRGMRLFRVDNGVHTQLAGRTDSIDPPGRWRIEFTETGFQVLGDDEPVAFLDQFDADPLDEEISDTTYRSGFFGVWCYLNAGQNIGYDNLAIDFSPPDCPDVSPTSVLVRMEETNTLEIRAPYGKNETEPYTVTITTSDPATVALMDGGGESLTVVFDVGDPLIKMVGLEALKEGTAELTVSTDGQACPDATVSVTVGPKPETLFTEDFSDEIDGPPFDFFVVNQEGTIAGEQLVLRPAGAGEPTTWIGIEGVPLAFDGVGKVSFNIEFTEFPGFIPHSGDIGRHGGVVICGGDPTTRWSNSNYTFDYLERDQVFRVIKNLAPPPNGQYRTLLVTDPDYSEPGNEWVIELTGTTMTFAVDGEQIMTVNDADLRSGYIGFWGYTNVGQEIFVDDIEVTFTKPECVTMTPDAISMRPWYTPTPLTVTIPFAANATEDYTVQLTSSDPLVAKAAGSNAQGDLTLVFEAGESMTQTVDIELVGDAGIAEIRLVNDNPDCEAVATTVEIRGPFADDFSQADGAPENWTVFTGDWTVFDGQLTNAAMAAAPGPWIWAGQPPAWFEDVERITLNQYFGDAPLNDVGNHGGIMFYASAPTQRALMSGYEIDWIDRETDRGYRFLRFDNGVQTVLATSIPDPLSMPGEAWSVTFNGDEILFEVDEEEVFTVFDNTYRAGYMGLWVYQNSTVMMIDDFVVDEGDDVVTDPQFMRGDVNVDGKIDLADAISILQFSFSEGLLACVNSADTNDDGKINLADPITLLTYQFSNGDDFPPPFEACGEDPTPDTPDLGCESYSLCE